VRNEGISIQKRAKVGVSVGQCGGWGWGLGFVEKLIVFPEEELIVIRNKGVYHV
jgi:hypothetical protein